MARGKRQPVSHVSGGWWFVARGDRANHDWCPPFEAPNKEKALEKSGLGLNEIMDLHGPFLSQWDAWNKLQEWLGSLSESQASQD